MGASDFACGLKMRMASLNILEVGHHIWSAIVASSGFGRSFPQWVVTRAMLPWMDPPSLSQVGTLKDAVLAFANRCASEAWRRKKLYFNEQVEKSWNAEGGSLLFRLLKDPQRPPVLDMTIQTPVRLAPQRW